VAAVLASELIGRAAQALQDLDHVRWSAADLLGHLNEGVRQVALVRPDATAATLVVELAAGTRQSLPEGCARLLAVVRNMGPDGATPGRAVTRVERDLLDAWDPGWHAAPGDPAAPAEVGQYAYDARLPRTFWTCPPVAEGAQATVEIAASLAPAPCAGPDDPVGLDPVYAGPVLDWMLHRAFSADAGPPENRARAETHRQAFYESLGQKLKADVLADPE
jgi:hypothetical protein